ncbi:hypothetical protein LTR08_003722 [Meristemomyces frigidus]|nr:hypothetical protein LTR08_003722 [Meristemomyces frigidus]
MFRPHRTRGHEGLDEHGHSVQHSPDADRLVKRPAPGASSRRKLLTVRDQQKPACSKCEKAGVECVRGYNIRFRHSANPSVSDENKGPVSAKTDFDFSKSQPWVNTARNLTFLDETQELISIYDHAAEHETSYAVSPALANAVRSAEPSDLDSSSAPGNSPAAGGAAFLERIDSTVQTSSGDVASLSKRRRLTSDSRDQEFSAASASPSQPYQRPASSWYAPHTGWTPGASQHLGESRTAEDTLGCDSLEPAVSLTGQSPTSVSDSLSRIYLETPVWPLQKRKEAHLLRHYVEKLARNFDLTDPLKHFRTVVPQRAATCPTLLNAIFALSARHLSRVGEYDPMVSNMYHQECLKHLIPMLGDTTAILDENLLASTIILRHMEEIEVPLSGQSPSDQQSHLFGAHALITAQERATMTGGLRQAAFWVGLRQEIYVAFVNQRSIIPALTHCNIDRSLDAAADHVWACRMVVLCADVIRYCFGEGVQLLATYTFLADAVAEWNSCKPLSFTPIYYCAAEDVGPKHVFPEMWFVDDGIVIGLGHYHLARILLASHNPGVPRLGPGRTVALRTMDDEIREHVRALCGMCLCNASSPPNFTYASIGVTMAGDKFTERREQDALLNVLHMCDLQHAWPTGAAIRNLKVAWGWEDG